MVGSTTRRPRPRRQRSHPPRHRQPSPDDPGGKAPRLREDARGREGASSSEVRKTDLLPTLLLRRGTAPSARLRRGQRSRPPRHRHRQTIPGGRRRDGGRTRAGARGRRLAGFGRRTSSPPSSSARGGLRRRHTAVGDDAHARRAIAIAIAIAGRSWGEGAATAGGREGASSSGVQKTDLLPPLLLRRGRTVPSARRHRGRR